MTPMPAAFSALRSVLRIAALSILLLLAISFSPLQAQYTYAAFSSVSSTNSTAVAFVQSSSHDATVRFPSILIGCSGACGVRIYEGGTLPTGTLSNAYPKATKANNTHSLLTNGLVKYYTAADSTGGTIIGGADCAAACLYPITGILPDRGSNRHSMELPRKTAAQYYIVVTGSSINVTFSSVLEVVR